MPAWSTFAATAAVLLVAAGWALRSLERGRGSARLPVAFVTLATAVGLFLARSATLDGAPLVEADLTVDGGALIVPPHDAPEVVALHAMPAEGTQATYTVSVRRDGQEIARSHGVFETRLTRRAIGRGAATTVVEAHTDERFVLPPSPTPQSVELVQLSGEIVGPVHARVLPAPPDPGAVTAVALATTVGGAIVDLLAGGTTGLAVFGPFVGLFALVEVAGLTPESGVRAPLVAGLGSFAAASLAGPALRRVLRAVLPRRPR